MTPIVRVVDSVTPDVSYGGMLASAVGIVGVVVVAGVLAGAIAGVLFIQYRRRQVERDDPSTKAVELKLNSLN
jgi:hypothetical protein